MKFANPVVTVNFIESSPAYVGLDYFPTLLKYFVLILIYSVYCLLCDMVNSESCMTSVCHVRMFSIEKSLF